MLDSGQYYDSAGTWKTCKDHQACGRMQYLKGASADAKGTCANCTNATCGATEYQDGQCDEKRPSFTCRACPGAAQLPTRRCAAGQVVASGTQPITLTGGCQACATGQFQPAACPSENTSCTAWRVCPAGTYIATQPSPAADLTCAVCAKGTWQNETNSGACNPSQSCPVGTRVLAKSTPVTDTVCSASATSPRPGALNSAPIPTADSTPATPGRTAAATGATNRAGGLDANTNSSASGKGAGVDEDDDGVLFGLGLPALIGIGVGAVCILVLLVLVCCRCCCGGGDDDDYDDYPAGHQANNGTLVNDTFAMGTLPG